MAGFVDNNVILHPTRDEFYKQYFRNGEEYDTYVFPKDTRLFSAFRESLHNKSNEEIASKVYPKIGNSYFGFHNETAMIYGYSFAYITNQQITLVAIDSIKTMRYLWRLANGNQRIQQALRTSYGFLDEYLIENPKKPYKTQLRNSFSGVDWPFVEFLCQNGFAGYAANEMITPTGHTFHPECVICSNGTLNSVNLNDEYHVNNIPGLATPLEKFNEAESLMMKRKCDEGKPKKGKKSCISLSPDKLSNISQLKFDNDIDDDISRISLNFDDDDKLAGIPQFKLYDDDDVNGGTIIKKQRTKKRRTHRKKRNIKKRQNKSRK